MNLQDAFLQAVRAAPDEDAPRLLYADWLDERGEHGHAEVIRLQCELARAAEDDPRHDDLTKRSAALEKAHAKAVLRPLRAALNRPRRQLTHWKFRRGFLEELFLTPRRAG